MGRAPHPLRILFVDHTAKLGGGEIALLHLARHLDRRRFVPIVLLFADGPLRERLVKAGIETHLVPLSSRVADARKDSLGSSSLLRVRDVSATLRHVIKVAQFIRRRRVDLVHTNSLKADVIGGIAGRLAAKPVIWHVRDRIDRDYLPASVAAMFRRLCRVIPNFVIANSAATLLTLELPKGKPSAVITSGIDLSAFMQPTDGSRAGGNGRVRTVGIVGRISPWKGQHIFIQAAARVHARFPDVRFQIVGAPLFEERSYESDLRNLVRSTGLDDCVEFAGFQEDVPRLIGGLEVLVHASTTPEPFGQVVVQGMAAGKPVVATAGGGILEILEHGKTGILVPMGDVDAMGRAICELLADPVRAGEIAQNARTRASSFAIDQVVRQIQNVYTSMSGRQTVGVLGKATIQPALNRTLQ